MAPDDRDDPDKLAGDLEREADRLQRESQRVEQDADRVRKDWERKARDDSVPGAVPFPEEPAEPEGSGDEGDKRDQE